MAQDTSKRQDQTRRRRDSMGSDPAEERWPRLPAERDESADSQDQGVREVIRQAGEDLQRGVKDTSRKPEMDQAYEKQKGAGAPGTAPAAPDASGVKGPAGG